jgi:hypothetical protein
LLEKACRRPAKYFWLHTEIAAPGRIALLLAIAVTGFAQEPAFHDLHVEKKPGSSLGPAVITSKGKRRQIAKEASQAWPVLSGRSALILVSRLKQLKPGEYELQLYDAEGKRRNLGVVGFGSAELSEQSLGEDNAVFALSGRNNETPEVVIADVYGIHGRLRGASAAKTENDTVTYRTQAGGIEAAAIKTVLGLDMAGIYQVPAGSPTATTTYVQFLRDGSAAFAKQGSELETGEWWTDGSTMFVTLKSGYRYAWLRKSLIPTEGIPEGTRVVVRLIEALSSLTAKEGDPIKVVLISPAYVDGRILLPQGSELTGTISKAHGVGFGVRHETAALTVEFNSVHVADGPVQPIHARLYEIENSREKVDDKGTIRGIRSTGTLGHTAEGKIASVAAVDPIAYLFTTTSATATLGYAEPEILYPSGTELQVMFTAPFITSQEYQSSIPRIASNSSEQRALVQFVRNLPFRTTTQIGNKPSDITNLVFIGRPEALRRAFTAAGWVSADALTAGSTFQTLKSISGNLTYNEAPMSTLLLDERPPLFTLSKTTNTFSSRHHLRVFDPASRFQGETALTSSSTQDVGIAFSKKKRTFIHVIDEYIDNERSKVVNDLEFTGCVGAEDLVPRDWVPKDAYNSTGDRLRTDGAIAVLRINDCPNPRSTPTIEAPPASRFTRITRDAMLTVRNDLWRGNLGYQGYEGVRQLRNYLAHKDELKINPGNWRTADLAGTEFTGVGAVAPERQSSAHVETGEEAEVPGKDTPEPSHRWDPPHYEIGLNGGYFRYPQERAQGVGFLLTPDSTLADQTAYGVVLADVLDSSWAAGISLTVNSWKWVSNEFAYHYQRGKYEIASVAFGTDDSDPDIESDRVGLITRQFEYNVLIHARPPTSRWRPYFAVGPTLQLLTLADQPIRKADGPFKLGLQSVGLLKAAFDFGSTPPLEGGGVFQFGLQYGGGIKYRVHPRITVRADFRETWSKNPNFIESTFTEDYFDTEGYTTQFFRSGSESSFRQQRFTLGVAFTF